MQLLVKVIVMLLVRPSAAVNLTSNFFANVVFGDVKVKLDPDVYAPVKVVLRMRFPNLSSSETAALVTGLVLVGVPSSAEQVKSSMAKDNRVVF